MRSPCRLAALLFALAAIPTLGFSQERSGAIEGVVKDTSGAILPGATVEARRAGADELRPVCDVLRVQGGPPRSPDAELRGRAQHETRNAGADGQTSLRRQDGFGADVACREQLKFRDFEEPQKRGIKEE